MDGIFVLIPSFQEEDLVKTVDSIFENANEPNRVFVGICNQRSDDGDFETFPCYGDHVRVINLRSPFPLGLGNAYYLASQLLQQEKFCLRIDAHTRMKKDWDKTLIEYYNLISEKENNKKIILTHLTGGVYKIKRESDDDVKAQNEDVWLHEKEPPNLDSWMDHQVWQLCTFALQSEHTKQTDYVWTDSDLENGYKEVHMVSGSFHFSLRDFLFDCEADSRLFFWGEEHIFAMRAWTRGYRMYGIKVNTQFTAGKSEEYYKTIGINDWRKKLTAEQWNNPISLSGSQMDHHASKILKGEELGFYGAKDQESYDAYMEKIGFNKHI